MFVNGRLFYNLMLKKKKHHAKQQTQISWGADGLLIGIKVEGRKVWLERNVTEVTKTRLACSWNSLME